MNINTLHICNYSVTEDKHFYAQLVKKNDCVVVYSQDLDNKQYDELLQLFDDDFKQVYCIIEQNKHHIPAINHAQWLDLINQSKRTFTWK